MLPMSSLYRMNKFLRKGYTITDESLLLLTLTINQLKLSNYSDLKHKLKEIPLNNANKNILRSNGRHDWNKPIFLNKEIDIDEVEAWLYSDSTYEPADYQNTRGNEKILRDAQLSEKAKATIV